MYQVQVGAPFFLLNDFEMRALISVSSTLCVPAGRRPEGLSHPALLQKGLN